MLAEVSRLSNERLEQEIAMFYVEGAKRAPGSVVTGAVLSLMWSEFDRRVEAGVIVVE